DAVALCSTPCVVASHPIGDVIADVTSGAICVGIRDYPLRIAVAEGLSIAQITPQMALSLLPPDAEILASQLNLGLWGEEVVSVRRGRYGPYLRCGQLICGLRKADDPETITLEQAIAKLEARARMGPKKKKGKKGPKTPKVYI
ncbi:hypothetical protein B484DRAFT_390528, partial [Ochromonadaceae sp. CCMP2298]